MGFGSDGVIGFEMYLFIVVEIACSRISVKMWSDIGRRRNDGWCLRKPLSVY